METRTELILLQRTMVVVEGVARTLDPHMNIWQSARPVVERYIRESIGPEAFLRDISRTVRVLARFGPRLPQLTEAALINLGRPRDPVVLRPRPARATWFVAGALLATILALLFNAL